MATPFVRSRLPSAIKPVSTAVSALGRWPAAGYHVETPASVAGREVEYYG